MTQRFVALYRTGLPFPQFTQQWFVVVSFDHCRGVVVARPENGGPDTAFEVCSGMAPPMGGRDKVAREENDIVFYLPPYPQHHWLIAPEYSECIQFWYDVSLEQHNVTNS
jgi:hypothetical protein